MRSVHPTTIHRRPFMVLVVVFTSAGLGLWNVHLQMNVGKLYYLVVTAIIYDSFDLAVY